MKIEINRFCIYILLVLLLGYFSIFVVIVTQPNGSYSSLRLEVIDKLDEARRMISDKNSEIDLMKLNIMKSSNYLLINPEDKTNFESTKTLNYNRPGVIILGMHRSGTSVLGGLINRMGLNAGGPLIQPASDNEKGFFERIDVVLQNDYIMKKQSIYYSFKTYKYNALQGLSDIFMEANNNTKKKTYPYESDFFKEGSKGLAFLNNPNNYPWMLKDPRLCITIRTWLPLLNFIPAILFTYRHPLDVALSMNKRQYEQFQISRSLRLWYVYNKQAILNSNDLCRVTTSHRLVMTQPEIELNRIYIELKECGLNIPNKIKTESINEFIDINLQHGKSTLKKKNDCLENLDTITPPDSWPTTDRDHIKLFRSCIKLYCAMEDKTAFLSDYKFDDNIKDGN